MTNKQQGTTYIIEIVSLDDLTAYLKKHNLEIVPQSFKWLSDGPHLWTQKRKATNISDKEISYEHL